jgi:hypothetical protein
MIEKLKDSLVDDAGQAWKFASMQIVAAIGALDLLYEHLPFAQQYLPDNAVAYLAGAAIFARIYKQKNIDRK